MMLEHLTLRDVAIGVTGGFLLVAILIFSIVVADRSMAAKREADAQIAIAARNQWLLECISPRRIDECTRVWSVDPTLRQVYRERVQAR